VPFNREADAFFRSDHRDGGVGVVVRVLREELGNDLSSVGENAVDICEGSAAVNGKVKFAVAPHGGIEATRRVRGMVKAKWLQVNCAFFACLLGRIDCWGEGRRSGI